MDSLRAVAITDGETSLHSPLFVVGVTIAVGVAGDEQEDATRASPAAAKKYGLKKRGRTGAQFTARSGISERGVRRLRPDSLQELFFPDPRESSPELGSFLLVSESRNGSEQPPKSA